MHGIDSTKPVCGYRVETTGHAQIRPHVTRVIAAGKEVTMWSLFTKMYIRHNSWNTKSRTLVRARVLGGAEPQILRNDK